MSEDKPYWKKLRNAGLIVVGIGLLFGIVFGPIFASTYYTWNVMQGLTSLIFLILGGVLILVGIIILISFGHEKRKIKEIKKERAEE